MIMSDTVWCLLKSVSETARPIRRIIFSLCIMWFDFDVINCFLNRNLESHTTLEWDSYPRGPVYKISYDLS